MRQAYRETLVSLSLDPIDRSPLGNLMKFAQRSFPNMELTTHAVTRTLHAILFRL